MIVIAYKDIFAKIKSTFKAPANAKDVMTTLLHIDWAVNGLSWQSKPRVFAMNSSGKLIQIGGPVTGQPERLLVIGHGKSGKIGNLTLHEVESLADQINKVGSIKLLPKTDLYITACYSAVTPGTGKSLVDIFKDHTTKFNVTGYNNTTITHSVFGNTIYIVGSGNNTDWDTAESGLMTTHQAKLISWCNGSPVSATFPAIVGGLNRGSGLNPPKNYTALKNEAVNVATITSDAYNKLISVTMSGKCDSDTIS